MSPGLKFFLLIALIGAIIDIIPNIKRLIPMVKRAREIKQLQSSYDVMSVEGEIIEIHTEQIGEMDTQYNIKIYYEVGWQKYYKDFIVMNKQSVRVGQKITLLYDRENPEKALLQNMQGLLGEEKGLKSTVFNLIIASIIIIADLAITIYEYTSGLELY